MLETNMKHRIASPTCPESAQVQKRFPVRVSLTRSSHQTRQMAKRGPRLCKALTVLNIVQQGNPRGEFCSLPLGWQVQSCLFTSAWQVPLFQSCTVDRKILVSVQIISVCTTETWRTGGRVLRDLHYSSECSQTLTLAQAPPFWT